MKEKKEKFWTIASMIFYGLAAVAFIASLFINEKETVKAVSGFGWMFYIIACKCEINCNNYAIMYLKEDIRSISYAINTLAENVREELYGTDEDETPEEDTKETAIVSPEDFERFQKGEMTKEELLGIKKAVDKVTEAKKKSC
jgi:hypothetical protein